MNLGIPTFGADGGKSGISAYLIEMLKQFAQLGVEGDVMVYQDEEKIFLPEGQHGLRASYVSPLVRKPLPNLVYTQAILPLRSASAGYDVLFLPAGNRRLPLFSHCPTAGVVHDLASIHVTDKYDSFRLFYITKVLPILIRRLDQVITISEFSKNDILDFVGVPESKVHVIPLAVNHDTYYPRDKTECYDIVQDKYGVKEPYFLYISRIEHPGKNHFRLIQAFDLLKEEHKVPHQLILAGGDWDRAEEVHQRAAESPYADDIIFTGFAPTEMIPILYGGAEALIFPSLFEGFGLPILEAMACGIPVACSRRASLPEVAGEAGLMFEAEEVESIAETMSELALKDSLRQDLREKGLVHAATYNWRRTAEETLDVLEGLA
jgi:glycosyltransferase involved in cell wall biosynthesis